MELFRRIQSELNKTTSSLATLAMLVSTLEYPELDVSEELQSFDELKTVLSRRIPYDSTLLEQLNEISEYLFSELGFTGNVQNYYDHRNSFLNEVLNRRLGIPITLGILYLEVASKLGINVRGIGMPGHFLVGAYSESQTFYVDVFNNGTVITTSECKTMFDSHLSQTLNWDDGFLAPVDDRYVIARLLRNLKYIYLSEGRNRKAYVIMNILVELEPDNIFERKDRGMLGFRVGHHKQSIEDLKCFLEKEPVGRSAVEASSMLEMLEDRLKRW
ncbi:transglutaminase-like domain-containing protein [Chloroflexi bacterium]|nr:transglutaminase-like domain-containing protein [Chloroflexota bacterium]